MNIVFSHNFIIAHHKSTNGLIVQQTATAHIMSPVVNVIRFGNGNIIIDTNLKEKHFSMMTADFLSTKHDPEELRQIACLEIDLSDEDFHYDSNIQRQLELNKERLSMMTNCFLSTKEDSGVLRNIEGQVSVKRLSMTTADFLSTKHDPEVLRKISSIKVDLSNDDFQDDYDTKSTIMSVDSSSTDYKINSTELDITYDDALHCPGLKLSVTGDDDDDYYFYDDETNSDITTEERKAGVYYHGKIRIRVIDATLIGFLLGFIANSVLF